MQYTDLEQQRKYVVEKLQEQPDPEHLWECILAFQGYEFRTISGLPFTYQLKKGKNGNLTKERPTYLLKKSLLLYQYLHNHSN